MNHLFKILLATMMIISCRNRPHEIAAPIRKAGIPSNAFWIGGVDGGNWYLIESIHSHKNNAFIKIYNDQNGSLVVSKRFVLICPQFNQQWIKDLQTQINAFDGEKIYLKAPPGKTNCWLQ